MAGCTQQTGQQQNRIDQLLSQRERCGEPVKFLAQSQLAINADSRSFAKGDVEHSIPVLGFYGNWSDPTMFGASYTDTLYGNIRKPYFGDAETNNLVVSRDGELFLHTGNPYVLEESYPAGKAAVRSSDILDSYRLTLLRNAAAMMLTIQDENGNEVYNSGVSNLKLGAYYYVNGSEWRNTSADYALGVIPGELGPIPTKP